MVLLYPLVLLAAAVLLWRRRGRLGGRGWAWFGAWSTAGALFAFSFLAGFSFGLLVLPFAAAALLFVASRAPHLSESLGFAAGVGATLLLIAFLNRDYRPCPQNGVLSSPPDAPPGTSVECGGFDPIPWLVTGLVVGALGVFAYVFASRMRAAPNVSDG